ncbi:MAG: DUF4393 domain-containing protein [Actinomycetota bacterium]
MSILDDLGKNLPIQGVYQDLAQPAVREAGEALGNVAKVARFALAPIDYLASFQDRWQRYLKRLSEKVPEERLVEPSPQVAGRVLDGLRYADEDGVIAEMFLNLLARAMDKDRVSEAHPAFPLLISQLSPDEAMFLFQVKGPGVRRVEKYIDPHSLTYGYPRRSSVAYDFPLDVLSFPGNIEIYHNHLRTLNLIGEELVGEPDHSESERSGYTTTAVEENIEFTPFGRLFARACIPDAVPPSK